MKDRNKIVIPTGHEPQEGLETPHFDAEETLLAARPVVPLTEEAKEAAQKVRAEEFAAKPLSQRLPILALIIIAAVSVGLASGLAIGLYQGHPKPMTQVTAQSSTTTTTASADTQLKQKTAPETDQPQLPSVQTVADTEPKATDPAALSQSDSAPQAKDATKTSEQTEASDNPKPEQPVTPDKKREDEKQSAPPAPSQKRPEGLREGDDGPKKQKLPRRRPPTIDEDPDVVPRTVERANQELNRIREIFEGPRP
jgi:hypothetical protein